MIFMCRQISNESKKGLLSKMLGGNHLNPLSNKDIASYITAAETLFDINFPFDVFDILNERYDKKPDLLRRDLLVGRDVEKSLRSELNQNYNLINNYSTSNLLSVRTLNNILDKYARSKDYLVKTGIYFESNQPKYSFRK